MKATIKLTPRVIQQIKDQKEAFAVNTIIIDEKGITYKIESNYEDQVVKTFEGIETERKSFTHKKFERGRIRRDMLMSVTRSSATSIDEEKVSKEDEEFTYEEHMIILETSSVPIGLTCTLDELKTYYKYIEDYYNGGDLWKELATIQENETSK